jgi:hypothetical protein
MRATVKNDVLNQLFQIRDLDNVFPVSKLPILESLNLQGNPVTTVVDYRLKVFESFGKR